MEEEVSLSLQFIPFVASLNFRNIWFLTIDNSDIGIVHTVRIIFQALSLVVSFSGEPQKLDRASSFTLDIASSWNQHLSSLQWSLMIVIVHAPSLCMERLSPAHLETGFRSKFPVHNKRMTDANQLVTHLVFSVILNNPAVATSQLPQH